MDRNCLALKDTLTIARNKAIEIKFQLNALDRPGFFQRHFGNLKKKKEEIDISDSTASTKPKKPTKHKHGEYSNVLLTDEELDKLKSEYFDWEERIERLSSYIASTGKAYKSHYATIRNWARKDAAQVQKPITGRPTGRQTKAEELDDFYHMAADWAKGG